MASSTTTIRIGLPLDMALCGQLLEVLGAGWPDAMIRTDTGDTDHMVVDLGVSAGTLPEPQPPLDSDGLAVGSFGDTVGIHAPEWITRTFITMFEQLIDEHPSAENYVELNAFEPGDTRKWSVIVCRPEGRTPHQLRSDAEAQRDRYATVLAKVSSGDIVCDGGVWTNRDGTALDADTAQVLAAPAA